MHDRLRAVAAISAIALVIPVLSFGQGQSSNTPDVDPGWEIPRMPNGQPDLQGYWTTQTFTPMERPEYLGDQAFYSQEEWAQLQAQLIVDGADPLARHVITSDDVQLGDVRDESKD